MRCDTFNLFYLIPGAAGFDFKIARCLTCKKWRPFHETKIPLGRPREGACVRNPAYESTTASDDICNQFEPKEPDNA